ncbi:MULTISPECIES: RcnB family protein [unclassified Caballeronia]|uniref:RcnB family protein n=1 Tax=unclassified Caballeronia TaxID=2646786 RepID=UPI00285D52B6|nr:MULTISPECIES: RcnB family protein [unclassified Caballeronia]MDR5815155.1 RcnB family protein [Caballeronia sp. LZ033]MDR5879845.1 RcnB family protein [Caballeronia sp. LZ032]
MKKARIVAALICANLGLTTGAAFAQPAPGGPDQHHDMHGGPGGPGGPGAHQARGPQGGADHGPGPGMNGHQPGGPAEHANQPPPHGEWRKGQRLSSEYRDHEYVVDNWHEHGLRQPPRGYQWVGVGADYLLVAVASGVIAQVMLSQ